MMETDLSITHRQRKRAAATRVIALGAALALGGCDLNWEKPDLSAPPPERFKEAKPVSAPPIPSGADFAAQFRSKELTGLVEAALDGNQDVIAATARIAEADAQARVASAALWPSVGLQNIARTTRTPGTVVGFSSLLGTQTGNTGFSALHYGFFQLGLTASYELDIWGKNDAGSKSARILSNAMRFDRDLVEIATVSSVLNGYFQVLAAQDRLRIAHNNVAVAQRVSNAIKARFDIGSATILDTSQQEAVVEQQRVRIPQLEQIAQQTRNQLAVLLGRTPESTKIAGGARASLAYPRITPGLPSEVLLRRPDVAEAEARLASQEFSVLQARASFFPSLSLTGLYGTQSALIANLARPEAVAWQAMAQLAQPLLDGYALQGNYELQKAKYAELAALYRKQILSALSDTENALIAVRDTSRALAAQHRAVKADERALWAAELRLNEGTIDVITLATTQRQLFADQDQEVQIRLAHFQAMTSLYQALGGGWSPTTRDIEIARADEAYEANKGPWP